MTRTVFTEGHNETYISKHHTTQVSHFPVQVVRESVCSDVRQKLEAFGFAKCDGCKEVCITK